MTVKEVRSDYLDSRRRARMRTFIKAVYLSLAAANHL